MITTLLTSKNIYQSKLKVNQLYKKKLQHNRNFSNENIVKGFAFEKQVIERLFKLGYYVFANGLIHDKDDEGIDILAYDKDEKELFLIQCKNWENTPITHKELKIFKAECDDYLNKQKRKILDKFNKFTFAYVVSHDNIKDCAKHYIDKQNGKIEYHIQEYIQRNKDKYTHLIIDLLAEEYDKTNIEITTALFNLGYIDKNNQLTKKALEIGAKKRGEYLTFPRDIDLGFSN